MFHFPALPPPALCVQAGVTGNYARQVSLFGNPRINVWLPTSRGLSQAPTSFFGSWCQGIHRVPLSTWQLLDARVHYAVLKIRAAPRRNPPHPRRAVTVRERQAEPVPSGPNSVPAQSLTRRHRSSSPEGKPYWTGTEIRPGRITRCPQMSSHLKTLA